MRTAQSAGKDTERHCRRFHLCQEEIHLRKKSNENNDEKARYAKESVRTSVLKFDPGFIFS